MYMFLAEHDARILLYIQLIFLGVRNEKKCCVTYGNRQRAHQRAQVYGLANNPLKKQTSFLHVCDPEIIE